MRAWKESVAEGEARAVREAVVRLEWDGCWEEEEGLWVEEVLRDEEALWGEGLWGKEDEVGEVAVE